MELIELKILSCYATSCSQNNHLLFDAQNRNSALRPATLLSSCRYMSTELPYHVVAGMPALSPTMETGTLASWYLKEGDAFGAGDPLCKIETDKATMDFEAQDDGFLAKILVHDGGEDIPCGEPIMVTVEDAEHVAAFKDYVLDAAAAAPAAAAATPEPVVVPEPVAAPVPVAPVAVAPPVVAVAAPPAPVAVAPVAIAPPAPAAPTVGPAWGSSARVTSPIAKTLAAKQQAYAALYGTTGQLPL